MWRSVFVWWTHCTAAVKKTNNFAVLYDLCIDFLLVSSYHKNAMIFIQDGRVWPIGFLTEHTI